MKRLVLMGGRPWMAADGGKQFVKVLLRYFPERARLAFCIFAQDEQDWEQTRRLNIDAIDRFRDKTEVEYRTMTAENFEEVSAWADIIYMPGGSPPKLKAALERHDDLAALWDDKVIAGSSAGADVLCEHYLCYTQGQELLDGLSWVKATCIPHWRNDGEDEEAQSRAEVQLLQKFPDLPVLCIPEGESVEIAVA